MNLIGKKVSHKSLGQGIIVGSKDDTHITVEFSSKTSSFQYPQIFETFLEAEDSDLQCQIMKEIQERQALKEAEKRAKLAALEEAVKSTRQGAEGTYSEKKHVPVKRTAGNPLTFLAFQGEFFDAQAEDQIIWTPIYNASGDRLFHWDNILNVNEGDIIIHCSGGYIKAVSRAKGPCIEWKNPNPKEEWGDLYTEGHKVDCEYTMLEIPLLTADYKEEILRYCQVKYAPFDVNGNANKGYLYDIDPRLASVFLKEIAKDNEEVAELEYIQWLLN